MSNKASNGMQQGLNLGEMPQLLMATSKLRHTPYFERLILLQRHHEQGSQGIILNQPSTVVLRDILEPLDLASDFPDIMAYPVLYGGPVQTNKAHLITLAPENTVDAYARYKAPPRDLAAITAELGANNIIIALGHVTWEKGELDQQIIDDLWILCPLDFSLLFKVPMEKRWALANRYMGFDQHTLPSYVGHG